MEAGVLRKTYSPYQIYSEVKLATVGYTPPTPERLSTNTRKLLQREFTPREICGKYADYGK